MQYSPILHHLTLTCRDRLTRSSDSCHTSAFSRKHVSRIRRNLPFRAWPMKAVMVYLSFTLREHWWMCFLSRDCNQPPYCLTSRITLPVRFFKKGKPPLSGWPESQLRHWFSYNSPTSCCHLLVDNMRSTRFRDCTTIELNGSGSTNQSSRCTTYGDFGPTDSASCFGSLHFLLRKLTSWMRRPRRTLSFPLLFGLTSVA